jgi:hypothetical protein
MVLKIVESEKGGEQRIDVGVRSLVRLASASSQPTSIISIHVHRPQQLPKGFVRHTYRAKRVQEKSDIVQKAMPPNGVEPVTSA